MTDRAIADVVERLERLETWANDFSCAAEHADAPVFITKAQEDENNARLAALRARTTLAKVQQQ